MRNRGRLILCILAGILIISGCADQVREKKSKTQGSKAETKYEIVPMKSVNLKQIYGIGYPGNDTALYVAGDNGLKMFKNSEWYKTTANLHDYIGFQATETGFVASGHPHKGASLKDPLGIVESVDKGNTVKELAFYGKRNFHFLAANYKEDSIFLINEQPGSGKDLSPGVSYSKDHGKTWRSSAFKGFNADSLGMIGVHPTNGSIIAMATRTGIFYSEDNGDNMKLITSPIMVTALTFAGDSILYSSVEDQKILLKRMNPKTGEQTNLKFPFLDYSNPITYLSVNPNNEKEMAFSTYKNDLYETTDGGKNWILLLKDGKTE